MIVWRVSLKTRTILSGCFLGLTMQQQTKSDALKVAGSVAILFSDTELIHDLPFFLFHQQHQGLKNMKPHIPSHKHVTIAKRQHHLRRFSASKTQSSHHLSTKSSQYGLFPIPHKLVCSTAVHVGLHVRSFSSNQTNYESTEITICFLICHRQKTHCPRTSKQSLSSSWCWFKSFNSWN